MLDGLSFLANELFSVSLRKFRWSSLTAAAARKLCELRYRKRLATCGRVPLTVLLGEAAAMINGE